MRKVGIRAFQQNVYKEVKDLPFTVTSRDKILFDVVGHVEKDDVATLPKENVAAIEDKVATSTPRAKLEEIKKTTGVATYLNGPKDYIETDKTTSRYQEPFDNQEELEVMARCQVPNIGCWDFGSKYRLTSYDSEGEVTKELFLCDLHVKKARAQGMEIVEL